MRKLILFSLGKFWKYREYSAGIALNILISLTVTSLFALSFKNAGLIGIAHTQQFHIDAGHVAN